MTKAFINGETIQAGDEATVNYGKRPHRLIVCRLHASDGGSDLTVSVSGAKINDADEDTFGGVSPGKSHSVNVSDGDELFTFDSVDGYQEVQLAVANGDTSDATVTLWAEGYSPYEDVF